jgi:transcription elongation factor Elf1
MKTILKKVKNFVITCGKCRTVFSYEIEDLNEPIYPAMVKCPVCEERLFHYKSEEVYDDEN